MSHRFRVPRSSYLAWQAARQAVAVGAGASHDDTKRLLGIIDTMQQMLRERCLHIGIVNEALTKGVEDGHIDELPPDFADELLGLLTKGVALAVEDSGLGGGHW